MQLTDQQAKELRENLEAIKEQCEAVSGIRSDVDEMQGEFKKLRKAFLSRGGISPGVRRPGYMTDEAAAGLGSTVILQLAGRGIKIGDDSVFRACAGHLGMEYKTAITASDIALPVEYSNNLRELQAEYGVCRQQMMHFPIGRGTAKPARLGTQDDFTFPVAMSSPFTEKNVKLGNASLESHKGGGILRLPREIDEQGIIPLGQMLARYAARKFGKVEDTVGFLGDGTATYDSIKGVCQIALEASKVTQLAVGQNKPSDVTIADLRSLRGLVTTPVLSSGKYYFHATWEQRLRALKTQADPFIYVQNGPGGMATFDGYPIVWTEVMAPYSSTTANPNAYATVFGDLSFWWMGEHGMARTDLSGEVYFATDEIAIRWLEEIDYDYMDTGAAAALRLAA